MILFDLMGYRCPTMQAKLRRGVKKFSQGPSDQLLIRSVDPRLMDNLNAFLAIEPGLENLTIVQTQKVPLPKDALSQWSNAGHHFDEEDIQDISEQLLVLLNKNVME